MNSMTGYGRAFADNENGSRVTVEISSVNGKKQADIRFSLPRELSMLEYSMRQVIQQNLERGSIQVSVSYVMSSADRTNFLSFNGETAAIWAKTLKDFALSNELPAPRISDVLSMPGIQEDNTEKLVDLLGPLAQDALLEALRELAENRAEEGSALKADLEARGRQVQTWLAEIDNRQDEAIQQQKERLRSRIVSMDPEIKMDEERLARELVYYVDRSDITEEVVRLKTHLDKYFELLARSEPVGRNLDFLGQEMNREITTLSSKTADLSISDYALQMKIEISKIREQIMNIE